MDLAAEDCGLAGSFAAQSDLQSATGGSSATQVANRRPRRRHSPSTDLTTEPLTASDCKSPPCIHQLPLELFVSIIKHALRDRFGRDPGLKRLIHLTHVAGAWRGTLQGTPFLWSKITSLSDSNIIQKALVHSNTHPLDIILAINASSRWSSAELVQLLLPHIARWRSFDYESVDADGLSHLQGQGALALQTLRVTLSESVQSAPWNLFNGMPATLTALHIRGTTLTWVPHRLRGLRKLTLEWMGMHGLPPCTVFQILLNNPDLESLIIRGLPDELDDSPPPIIPLVRLPQLQDFTIDSVSRQYLAQFLSNLVTPNCNFLYIELPYSSHHPDETLPFLDDITMQTLRRHVEHIQPWNLTGGAVELHMVGFGELVCEMELDKPHPGEYKIKVYIDPQLAGWVADNFLANLPHPRIQIVDDSFDIETPWLQYLQHLSTITMVEIHNRADEESEDDDDDNEIRGGGFAEYLAMPEEGEDGVWRWPFPGLERISFEDNLDQGGLLQAVTDRYSREFTGAWRPAERPKPFKRVHMRGLDMEIRQEMEKVIGPGCIVWASWLELPAEVRKEMSENDEMF